MAVAKGEVMQRAIQERIEAVTGGRVDAARRLSGGMISDAYALDMADGARLVAKIGDGSHDLRIEAYMLRFLREQSELPVPAVLHAEADLLLMEYIDGATGLDDKSRRHLAELMAGCHQIGADDYGLERDTLTGTDPPAQHADVVVDRVFPRPASAVYAGRGAGVREAAA